MNNKFIKRVAAVVLSVAVLSTCAFATAINESATKFNANDKVTFVYTTSGDKVSYIAYAVKNGVVTNEIVAIGQEDNVTNGGTVNISIDADKLAYCEAIEIHSGDSTGAEKVTFKVEEYEITTNKVSKDAQVIDGYTFTDLATVSIAGTGKNAGNYTLAGLKATVGEEPKTIPVITPAITVGNDGYSFTVGNIYLVGLDETQLAADISVLPNIIYSAN